MILLLVSLIVVAFKYSPYTREMYVFRSHILVFSDQSFYTVENEINKSSEIELHTYILPKTFVSRIVFDRFSQNCGDVNHGDGLYMYILNESGKWEKIRYLCGGDVSNRLGTCSTDLIPKNITGIKFVAVFPPTNIRLTESIKNIRIYKVADIGKEDIVYYGIKSNPVAKGSLYTKWEETIHERLPSPISANRVIVSVAIGHSSGCINEFKMRVYVNTTDLGVIDAGECLVQKIYENSYEFTEFHKYIFDILTTGENVNVTDIIVETSNYYSYCPGRGKTGGDSTVGPVFLLSTAKKPEGKQTKKWDLIYILILFIVISLLALIYYHFNKKHV